MNQQIERHNYAYEFNIASIASGGDAQDSLNIDTDSRFNWIKSAFFVDIAGAAQTYSSRVQPLVTVQLTDTGSGRQFFSDAVPIPTYFGSGEIPMILPLRQMFKPNATLKADFNNYSAATTYANLRLVLIGYKEYV